MISAQETPYAPAGNSFGRMPGMTTARGGTQPRCSTGSEPVTSMIGMDAVNTTFGAITAPAPTRTPSTTIAARADESAVLDDHRPRLRRLEHAADADAARRWTSAPICAHEPTVAQVSTIVRGPTHAPMFT